VVRICPAEVRLGLDRQGATPSHVPKVRGVLLDESDVSPKGVWI
jgi:hypothetical protein